MNQQDIDRRSLKNGFLGYLSSRFLRLLPGLCVMTVAVLAPQIFGMPGYFGVLLTISGAFVAGTVYENAKLKDRVERLEQLLTGLEPAGALYRKRIGDYDSKIKPQLKETPVPLILTPENAGSHFKS